MHIFIKDKSNNLLEYFQVLTPLKHISRTTKCKLAITDVPLVDKIYCNTSIVEFKKIVLTFYKVRFKENAKCIKVIFVALNKLINKSIIFFFNY